MTPTQPTVQAPLFRPAHGSEHARASVDLDIDLGVDSSLSTSMLMDVLAGNAAEVADVADLAARASTAAQALAARRLAAARGCPQCRGPAARVARNLPDRLLSLVMPVKRYRCCDLRCNWEGLLLSRKSRASSAGRA